MDVGFYGFLLALGGLFLVAQLLHQVKCIRRDGLKIIDPPDDDEQREPRAPTPQPPTTRSVATPKTAEQTAVTAQADTRRRIEVRGQLEDMCYRASRGGLITGDQLARFISNSEDL